MRSSRPTAVVAGNKGFLQPLRRTGRGSRAQVENTEPVNFTQTQHSPGKPPFKLSRQDSGAEAGDEADAKTPEDHKLIRKALDAAMDDKKNAARRSGEKTLQLEKLRTEVDDLRAQTEQLKRELEAARAMAGAPAISSESAESGGLRARVAELEEELAAAKAAAPIASLAAITTRGKRVVRAEEAPKPGVCVACDVRKGECNDLKAQLESSKAEVVSWKEKAAAAKRDAGDARAEAKAAIAAAEKSVAAASKGNQAALKAAEKSRDEADRRALADSQAALKAAEKARDEAERARDEAEKYRDEAEKRALIAIAAEQAAVADAETAAENEARKWKVAMASAQPRIDAALAEVEALREELARCKGREDLCIALEQERRLLHEQLSEARGSMRIFCRVRPALTDEAKADVIKVIASGTGAPTQVELAAAQTAAGERNGVTRFTCHHVFDGSTSQESVSREISLLTQSAIDGHKVCIFAYGQTGSGKTCARPHAFTLGPTRSHVDPLPSTPRVHALAGTVWAAHSLLAHLASAPCRNTVGRTLPPSLAYPFLGPLTSDPQPGPIWDVPGAGIRWLEVRMRRGASFLGRRSRSSNGAPS